MIAVRPTSLAATLDLAGEAFFYRKSIPTALREELVMLILSRQVQTGANAGFFIPFAAESVAQAHLFTGEPLHTNLARTHIRLIETSRLLKLLAPDNPAVHQSVLLANRRMNAVCYSQFCAKGECRALTIAYLRFLAADSASEPEPRIELFLDQLSRLRDGKGKWKGFPYFYSLLALSELNVPLATQELQYSTIGYKKHLEIGQSSDPISQRRQAIVSLVLARS